ncbi:hypothetical protein DV515_00019601, partial [Chloebia gouldiae]
MGGDPHCDSGLFGIWEGGVLLGFWDGGSEGVFFTVTRGFLGYGEVLVGFWGAEVTLTDRPPALPQLRENARRNFPGAAAPRVRALRWGRDQRRFPPKFHLILGSDIVYDPRAFAPLLGTLRHL